MPFVKLDCRILDSTLWPDRAARDVFLTALLMAEPYELDEPAPQLAVNSLESTGWMVPPGWYGLVKAAGAGIVRRALVEPDEGLRALERLSAPEPDSRNPAHDGRRLVRIAGGYVVLNFMVFRERDYTAAERAHRYRRHKRQREARTASKATRTAVATLRDRHAPAMDQPKKAGEG
jgi:hypothetical protein